MTLLHLADKIILADNERGPDDGLMLHFGAASKLTPEEKRTIKEVLEWMLLKHESKC